MSRSGQSIVQEQAAEAGIAAIIEQIKQKPKARKLLLDYLPQQHPIYKGKSLNEVKRARGYLFALFLDMGLPESALPYVLEVLETEHHAYLVAGASMALRGLSEPRPQLVPYLLKAINNVQLTDDKVSFDAYDSLIPSLNQTTALAEIAKTFQWLGGCAIDCVQELRQVCTDDYISDSIKSSFQQAIQSIEQDRRTYDRSCCGYSFVSHEKYPLFGKRSQLIRHPDTILLEDQDQRTISYKDYFTGKPSVVVFFYTRCDNPDKCSLTITRLRELQKDLQAEGLETKVKMAAITYDPFHDDPFRMKAYCEGRGMVSTDDNCVFRVTSGMPTVLQYFDSGVNFMGSLVNHHTTELFILDANGLIVSRHRQLQWQSASVITELKKMVAHKGEKSSVSLIAKKINTFVSPILSFFIVFFPKCPICWAAYLSIFGITNIHFRQFAFQSKPLLITLLCLNLIILYNGAKKRNGFLPFYLSVSGLVCIIFLGLFLHIKAVGYLGIGLLFIGALLNSLPYNIFIQFRFSFSRLFSAIFLIKKL